MQTVDNTNFEQVITSTNKPTLVKFYTDWCGPCKGLTPIIEKIATEYYEQCQFVEVNAEYQKELVSKYGVRTVPTLLLFESFTSEPIVINNKTETGIKTVINNLTNG